MKHAFLCAIIALLAGTCTTQAVHIGFFTSWDDLIRDSPDIVIARCTKAASSGMAGDGMIWSEVEVVSVLKGDTKTGSAKMVSQYWPRQDERFLMFSTYQANELYRAYNATESYRVVPLDRYFQMRDLDGKTVGQQIDVILRHRLLDVASKLEDLSKERKRLEMPVTLAQDVAYPNCVRIFNGQNFEGWEADPSTWSIVDGAMRGVGGTSRLAYTKADYGSFRLIFTSRMNPVNKDHLGVLFWGDRPTDPSKPKIDNAGWIQFMPPHGAMWDYHPPKHHNLSHVTLAEGSRDFTIWHVTELLCNLEKGTMRAAVDGVEIVHYSHPQPGERTDPETRIIAGPIGMFRHGGGTSEYKDIYVEADPKEDKLITLRGL